MVDPSHIVDMLVPAESISLETWTPEDRDEQISL